MCCQLQLVNNPNISLEISMKRLKLVGVKDSHSIIKLIISVEDENLMVSQSLRESRFACTEAVSYFDPLWLWT